jgi:hypothetical protein
MTDVYRPATYEEKLEAGIDEYYDLLVGPNGFECFLGEPEDRIWQRDGSQVVKELNHLSAGLKQAIRERDEAQKRLIQVADLLESAVCTKGDDKGVILLSQEGTTHPETYGDRTVQVYDNEYFSPLGEALIAAWKLAAGERKER